MARYLLDTNILSDLVRNPSGAAAIRASSEISGAVFTSIVVACELRYGVARKGSGALAQRIEQLLGAIEVMPLEANVDRHYGDIRCALEKVGTPLGANDLLIAAHARALGAVVVTDNEREFERVAGLGVENWLRPR